MAVRLIKQGIRVPWHQRKLRGTCNGCKARYEWLGKDGGHEVRFNMHFFWIACPACTCRVAGADYTGHPPERTPR